MIASQSHSAELKRIILFRFHDHLPICTQRLRLLASLNPDIPIYGIYGGEQKNFPHIQKALEHFMTHCYCIPRIPRHILRRTCRYDDMKKYAHTIEGVWKWKHCDFLINMWYREIGKDIDFDTAYLTEWDLLLFEPIPKLYKHVPRGCLGLTGLQLLKVAGIRWAITTQEPHRSEFEALIRYVQKKYHYKQDPYCSFGPGCSYLKKFLHEYSHANVPDFTIDEVRIPLFAQILGFPMRDTKLCPTRYDMEDFKLFNTNRVDVSLANLRRALALPKGRRVFHPYTMLLPTDLMARFCGKN